MNQKEISTVSVWDNEERYYLRERIALAVHESVKKGRFISKPLVANVTQYTIGLWAIQSRQLENGQRR